jgi:hypothetical protein
MDRKPKATPVKAKRARVVKRTKRHSPRAILNTPELRWVDSLLRSFQEEASTEWIPFPYQILLKTHAKRYRKPRVLH